MTKYLILIKHSLPEIDENHPANTWKLSLEGRSRALRLAEELEGFAPEVIFSSQEPKARDTAEILARHFGLEVEIVPGLHEHDRSNVAYLTAERFHASMQEFFRRPGELVLGRETADQAHARFYRAVHSILNAQQNKTILVLTHGTVISLFVSRLTGGSDRELWTQLGLPSYVAMDLHSSTLIVRTSIV